MKKYISFLITFLFFVSFFPATTSFAAVSVAKVQNLKSTAVYNYSVKLDWNDVPKASGYELYRYNFSTGKYYKLLTAKLSETTVSALSSATNYRFKVRAYRTVSGKTYRGEFSSVLKLTTKPKKPSGLSVTSYTTNTVTFKWNPVIRATGYKIYIYNAKAGEYQVHASTTKTGYTINNLEPATLKSVKVCAYRTVQKKLVLGYKSDTFLIGTKPDFPKNTSAAKSESGNVVISFSPVKGASGYMIYLYNKTSNSYKIKKNTEKTKIELADLLFDSYLFKVKAYRRSGDKYFYSDFSEVFGTEYGYDSGFENQVLEILNKKRVSNGLSQLKMTDGLRAAARARAEEMYDAGTLSHTRPDGTFCSTIFAEYDLGVISSSGATLKNWGENIARGYKGPQEVYDAWYLSDGHRANMLRSAFNYIGVGYYKGYWVQLFTS